MTQNEFIAKYGDLIIRWANVQKRDYPDGLVKPIWIIDNLIDYGANDLGCSFSETSKRRTTLGRWAKKHLIDNGFSKDLYTPLTKRKGR